MRRSWPLGGQKEWRETVATPWPTADPQFPADGLIGANQPKAKSSGSTLLAPRARGVQAGTRQSRLHRRDGDIDPLSLETALASDQPGFTSCVINRDVLSDNGRVVLMEKGTQVVGEYRGGLQRGQKRLFVLWNRAKTPKGVIVTLASPATDALGRAGVDGYVDTHWWERFGSALLLSIVGDRDLATRIARQRCRGPGHDERRPAGGGDRSGAIDQYSPDPHETSGLPRLDFCRTRSGFFRIYGLRVTEPRNTIFDRAVMGDFYPRSDIVTK